MLTNDIQAGLPQGRFPLPITLARPSPMKQPGTYRACSAGVVEMVSLAGYHSGFLLEKYGHVRKFV